MAQELVKRGTAPLALTGSGPLKKAAKKTAGKKAAKKTHGKKAAKHSSPSQSDAPTPKSSGFHHLQRAAAVISLIGNQSGSDLRMLLQLGVARYRQSTPGAEGLLRAAEHLAMAGLYAARVSHRVDVPAPAGDDVGKLLDRVSVRLDGLPETTIRATAAELLRRAEGAGDDVHLAWELAMAADALCDGAGAE